MPFNKFSWRDRLSQHPNQRILKNVSDGVETTVEIYRDEGEIGQEGTSFSASNMNNLEDRIASAVNPIVLYSSSNGTASGFSLSSNHTNYSLIKVYYGLSTSINLYNTAELIPGTGTRIPLTLTYMSDASAGNNKLFIHSCLLKFTGTAVTFERNSRFEIQSGSISSSYGDEIRVFKIWGYK